MGKKPFSVIAIILGLLISAFCIFVMIKSTVPITAGMYIFLAAGVLIAILGIVLLIANKKSEDKEEEDDDEYEED